MGHLAGAGSGFTRMGHFHIISGRLHSFLTKNIVIGDRMFCKNIRFKSTEQLSLKEMVFKATLRPLKEVLAKISNAAAKILTRMLL